MTKMNPTDLGLSMMSIKDLDRIALEHDGVVGSIVNLLDCPGDVSEFLIGGWKARWIDTRGMTNRGKLVLVPTNLRTRTIKRQGAIGYLSRLGIAPEIGDKLYSTKVPFKAEVYPLLPKILDNATLIDAFRKHPGEYGMGTNRGKWVREHESLLADAGLGDLSASRETSLAILVKAATDDLYREYVNIWTDAPKAA